MHIVEYNLTLITKIIECAYSLSLNYKNVHLIECNLSLSPKLLKCAYR